MGSEKRKGEIASKRARKERERERERERKLSERGGQRAPKARISISYIIKYQPGKASQRELTSALIC